PGSETADVARPIPGHGAPEAQGEAEPDEAFCLLPAAVEGMRDAAGHRHFAQVLQHAVLRAPDMEQDRQVVRPGDLELRPIEALLARRIETGNEEIKADLADRHELWIIAGIGQRGVELRESPLVAGIDAQGVDAQGEMDTVEARRQPSHRIEIARIDRRDDDPLDSSPLGPLDHGFEPYRDELAGVEMAMRIDEANRHLPLSFGDPAVAQREEAVGATGQLEVVGRDHEG